MHIALVQNWAWWTSMEGSMFCWRELHLDRIGREEPLLYLTPVTSKSQLSVTKNCWNRSKIGICEQLKNDISNIICFRDANEWENFETMSLMRMKEYRSSANSGWPWLITKCLRWVVPKWYRSASPSLHPRTAVYWPLPVTALLFFNNYYRLDQITHSFHFNQYFAWLFQLFTSFPY